MSYGLDLPVTKAAELFFEVYMPIGRSVAFQSKPGVGKTTVLGETAQAIIREQGGVYLGWDAHSSFVCDNPPAGERFKLIGDPHCPKVDPRCKGLPYLVYRYVLCTGLTSVDMRGAPIPQDTDPGRYLDLQLSAPPTGAPSGARKITPKSPPRGDFQEEPNFAELGAPTILPEPVSIFAKSFIFQGLPDKAKHCVLCLDEAKQEKMLFPMIASLCHGGRVGDFELPGEQNAAVLLANRAGDRAGNTEYTMNINDRVALMEVMADPLGHQTKLRAMDAPAWALTFCQPTIAADIVYDTEVPRDGRAYCSPRSFTFMVSELMQYEKVQGTLNPESIEVQAIVMARIGPGAAGRLLDVIRLNAVMPSLAEIERDPRAAKLPGNDPVAQIFLAETLARYVTSDNLAELAVYAQRLAKAPQALFVSAIVDRVNLMAEKKPDGRRDLSGMALLMHDSRAWKELYKEVYPLRQEHGLSKA